MSSGRSFDPDEDHVDIGDDDDDDGIERQSAQNASSSRSLFSGWSSVFSGGNSQWWLDTASTSFHFVMDAIDKIPQ